MSHANFLEKLLDGVAVEWKRLGELGSLIRGNGLQKKDGSSGFSVGSPCQELAG